MLDKQQKILQMAKDICRYQPCCNDVCKPISACDALKYAARAVEAGYCKPEWISVDERLPDNDGKYLVASEECGRYSISVRKFRKEVPCWYTGYCGHWERRTNGITHWMPLPEAPKMKGGDEK
jgi:hypothetical protein